MIDIFVPMLGRPWAAETVAASVAQNTAEDHQILFICSLDDEETYEACMAVSATMLMRAPVGPGDYPRKMNRAFERTDGDWVFLAASDVEFTRGWDIAALRMADKGAGVVATNDMANGMVKRGSLGTHSLVRRSYVDEHGATADHIPGVLIHEGYDHNFCDRELCGVAQHRGVYEFAKDSIVRHRHPNWRTAKNDATYDRGRAGFGADTDLFLSRAKKWKFRGLTTNEKMRAARMR